MTTTEISKNTQSITPLERKHIYTVLSPVTDPMAELLAQWSDRIAAKQTTAIPDYFHATGSGGKTTTSVYHQSYAKVSTRSTMI